MRNLQTLCESTQRISPALKLAHPEIDWQRISAFRNVLVHGYLAIDLVQVWEIIQIDLPDLAQKVNRILQR